MTVTEGRESVGAVGSDQRRKRRKGWSVSRESANATAEAMADVKPIDVHIDADDPLLELLRGLAEPVVIEDLPEASTAVRDLRSKGTRLVVPLVAAGELVGVIALGERLSERGYSREDRKLLQSLARHAAPALRLGQLVRQQENEARRLQRIESELHVAQLIQQQFLPTELPTMSGWQVDALYRPARVVGGDFYDVISLPDGKFVVIVGDVTGKGIPAALVMASTHALLRATAQPGVAASEVLRKVNEMLHRQIPVHTFVTCLVMVIDPATGDTTYANAGHNLPYLCRFDHVRRLEARGMPLGVLPDSTYEECSTVIHAGEIVLLYSDGISEQHNRSGQMFGFQRITEIAAAAPTGAILVEECLERLSAFADGVEQEDDITVVAVSRPAANDVRRLRFALASEPGNEREVMRRVLDFVGDALPAAQSANLGTAVSEIAMNAIEHGNRHNTELPVETEVAIDAGSVQVWIADLGEGSGGSELEAPDIDLKLAGEQTDRGWGLFLVRELVDELTEEVDGDRGRHTAHLTIRRRGREGGTS